MRKPYLILIGSASGIGKSTIAAELAKTLNIKHLVESDFIREVLRGIIGYEYAPALHLSSYDAYKCLRGKNKFKKEEELIAAGFEEHASFVIPALEKVISRAIDDYDDIIIEGVHLVPGLIDLDKFKDKADAHFFILATDEKTHRERFVERAIQIKRGGKQLDYFKENRIIHDYLNKLAKENDVPIIETDSLEKSIARMQMIISDNCAKLHLKYGIDEIPDVIDIIVRKNNGSIETIEHIMEDFNEPLVRTLNIVDEKTADSYLTSLAINPNVKIYLQNIINQTKISTTKICASSIEDLNNIIDELTEKNYISGD